LQDNCWSISAVHPDQHLTYVKILYFPLLLIANIMKALHIIKYGRFPVLENLPIPEIGDSDLLIRMKYAPINPSDLFFYQGKYSIIK
jgi:hypothetical protein